MAHTPLTRCQYTASLTVKLIKHQLTMVRITFGLFLLVSICKCQEAPGQPGSSNSVSPTPMPQFVRDMLTRLAEGKRDFHEAENREYQHSESQSGESLMSVICTQVTLALDFEFGSCYLGQGGLI